MAQIDIKDRNAVTFAFASLLIMMFLGYFHQATLLGYSETNTYYQDAMNQNLNEITNQISHDNATDYKGLQQSFVTNPGAQNILDPINSMVNSVMVAGKTAASIGSMFTYGLTVFIWLPADIAQFNTQIATIMFVLIVIWEFSTGYYLYTYVSGHNRT